MVIHDANVMRLTFDPFEDQSPLIIDPDRIEVLEITLELFQPVRWRDRQILQATCRVEGFELTRAVCAVLFRGTPPRDAVQEPLARDPREEA
jgi:hypothetical protein